MNIRFYSLLLLLLPTAAFGYSVKTPASESPYVFINKTDNTMVVNPINRTGHLDAPFYVAPGETKKIGSVALVQLLNPREYVSDKVKAVRRAFYITTDDKKNLQLVARFEQEPVSNLVRGCFEATADPLNSSCIKGVSIPEMLIYKFSLKNIVTRVYSNNEYTVATKSFLRVGTVGLPEIQLIVSKK